MKRIFQILVVATGCVCSVSSVSALETLPLEFRQTDIPFNFQSVRGVPISTVSNTPPGSDGRMTTVNQSVGSFLFPTTNQFRGFTSFGAIPGLPKADWMAASNSPFLNGTNTFSAIVASQMGLPVALSNDTVVIVMRRAQVGAPYLSRQVSFAFGAVVSVPITDEKGVPLTNITPEAYWLPEPHTGNGHTNSGYYWSINARKVYAIQPGPISITWIKAAYSTIPPTNGLYITNGGNYFSLFKVDYVVSGAAVKPSRKIYWTERGFRNLGKPVAVPNTRIGDLAIVYNNNFPRTAATEYVGPGDSNPTDGTTNAPLPELRTLWYDRAQGNIFAHNREGRVFVELLGDSRSDGQSREQLGFEIVDVFKQPTPLDTQIDLGERITPPSIGQLDQLTPEPILQGAVTPFAYQQNISGSGDIRLHAIRETLNVNDYLVHWMEEGEVGLKWPSLLGRYKFVWPNNAAKYSHYIRPAVATENEAKLTAVAMPTENVPIIQYQDPFDRPRAKMTETFAFYTHLEPPYSAHRTLLLYNSGDNIAFERVFSWLDTTLKGTNFASTVATNLIGWNPTSQTVTWPDALKAPRIVQQNVAVGRRITAPAGELGANVGEDYYTGHIRPENGTHYNVHAYRNPFSVGFEAANLGSIIPVNAVPSGGSGRTTRTRRKVSKPSIGRR